MTLEPKKLRDLEVKQEKVVEKMNKHKQLYFKYQSRLPKIADQISLEKNKQETIFT